MPKFPNAPCKDCDRRTMTCHMVCREYLNYKKEMEAFNAVRNAEIEKHRQLPSTVKFIEKQMRRKRKP